jgi:mycothione reductase
MISDAFCAQEIFRIEEPSKSVPSSGYFLNRNRYYLQDMEFYDLVVIGSGAGLTVLNAGLRRGLECALVESEKIGGTCLTRGCIPSKILVHPANLIRMAQHAKKVGIHFQNEIDWKLISERMWSQINESQKIEENLKQIPNLTVYRGIGEFVEDYALRVKLNDGRGYSEDFKGDRIVIASGARSFVPPIKGLDRVGYLTSDTFFGERFPRKPWNSLVIVGGGIIAAEFANIFSSFGTEIKMIEMRSRLVSTEETEISDFLKVNLDKLMKVYTNKKAVAARSEDKDKIVTVEDVDTGKKQDVSAEEIFVASGRRSNADLLKPQKTGVEVDKRGWIKTNEFLETTMKDIWCIGDANGGFQLRHRANYDAEICIHNMFSKEDRRARVDYSVTPWAIYSYPEIGHVGMTEEEAVKAGCQIYVAVKHYSSVAKGFAIGFDENDVDDGFVKLIVSKDRKILGAHIVGPHAAVLVQPFAYLMNAGFTCNSFEEASEAPIKRLSHPCPERGTFMPIENSMVIHPSLNEVTAWAIGSLRPVNIESEGE